MNLEGGAGFDRRHRLRATWEFRTVFDNKTSVRSRVVAVFYARREGGGRRLGVSVGRRFGGAVERNRIKRVFREVFRQRKHLLPPDVDIVMVPVNGALCARFRAVDDAFTSAARRIAEQWAKDEAKP